jgi:hypothetical protein
MSSGALGREYQMRLVAVMMLTSSGVLIPQVSLREKGETLALGLAA